MPEFTFRTNAKMKSLVGKELITNNNIAIYELIKNSYDAAAKNVEIRFCNFIKKSDGGWRSQEDSSIKVIDDGFGMTTDEIEKYWMELGNSSKQDTRIIRYESSKMNKIISRFVNGEKGIGRFGVDKIGSTLILESVGIDKLDTKTTVYFDWNKYDDRDKLLQEIKNEYKVESIRDAIESGTTLTIGNLREQWLQKDIEKLKKNISKFLSPNKSSNDEFNILFSYYENNTCISKEEIRNDTFEYLRCKLEANLHNNGICDIEIISNGNSYKETILAYKSGSPIGEIFSEIFYLDKGDKNLFTRKMGIRTSEYGNIKVYRGDFRILPYGEPHNDWLEIDKEHAQGVFRTFGTRDIVGNIFLKGESVSNQKIFTEATDRVGFIEDSKEFAYLKEFEWKLISILEDFVFNKIKKDSIEKTEIIKQESNDARLEFDESISELKKIVDESGLKTVDKEAIFKNIIQTQEKIYSNLDNVDKATDEVESKIKVYSQLRGKEGILFHMLHSIKNKLQIIEAQIRGFDLKILNKRYDEIDTSILKNSYKDIEKLVVGSLDKVNASKLSKSRIPVHSFFNDLEHQLKDQMLERQVDFEISINNNILKDFSLFASRELLLTVFDNLSNNSLKALSTIENPKIKLEVTYHEIKREYIIFFSDNGVGISSDNIVSLFTLWSSGTNGTGIGLSASRDIIEDMGGTISYVDREDTGYKTTFMIKLPRR